MRRTPKPPKSSQVGIEKTLLESALHLRGAFACRKETLMTPKFICDECFMPFVIHIKVSRKKTRKGVREQWLFSCPFCGKRYKAYDNKKTAEAEIIS